MKAYSQPSIRCGRWRAISAASGGSPFAPGFINAQLLARRHTDITNTCRARHWKGCWNVPTDKGRKKLVLVAGDSHGPDGFNMIFPALGNEHLILNSLPGCPPIVSGSALEKRGIPSLQCNRLNKVRTSQAYLKNFDVIVVSVLWGWYTPGDLSSFLEVVKKANPKGKIVVFGNYVVLNNICWQIRERTGGFDACFRDDNIKSKFLFENELRRTTLAYGGLFVSKKDDLCVGDVCPLFSGGIPYTWDKHHLSYEFAHMVGMKAKDQIYNYVESPTAGQQVNLGLSGPVDRPR